MTTTEREINLIVPAEGLADVPAGPNGDHVVRQEAASGIELEDVRTEEMLVSMGPQHPATHGVLRIVLRTDGEMILEAIPHLGYLHRCAEKIGENIAYFQFIPYTDRLDYVAGMNENWAFCRAVEQLGDVEVPRRAEFIRVIVGEMQRIASHLVTFGTYGLDIGAFTPFLYAFREREYVLDLFEMLCGARLTYSYFTIGGVTHDLPTGWLEKVIEFVDFFEPKIAEYNGLLSFNHIFVKRTANVGPLSKELAIAYAVTGPVMRATGLPYDLRRDKPFSVYPELDFDVVVGTGERGTLGDSWDRYMIRMREMEQCCRIIRQCVEMIPDASDDPATGGAHRAKVKRNFKPKAGEVYVETENPRGVLGFYVESQGAAQPYRVKARAGTFCNLSVLGELCRNVMLADVPAIVGSIDVVMGQVDR
ncbi:MAG: NADH-quinone oxidoreductase subunit D [Phycisphaerales bacterium]|nr:NADH-quinone oxidoreductase subunit D [Phycisphaerales bacterium]